MIATVARSRVLVTGVNGFVGGHVVNEFNRHDFEAIGIGREPEPVGSIGLADYVEADLTQSWPGVRGIDAVVHLAGLSAVGPSFNDPQRYIDVNGAMVNRLAAWAEEFAPHSRAVVVSSGAVYDSTTSGALDEDAPLAMSSPYVVSKLLVENLVGYYRRRGLDWVVARPFNHAGPGQGPGFLVPDLARQLVGLGSIREIAVGNLSTGRDYTDVRDVARAYRLLAEARTVDQWIYNVCSGRARTGHELLALLVAALGIEPVGTQVDPARIRPDDPLEIVGSSVRIRELTGWTPEISIDRCLRDFVSGL